PSQPGINGQIRCRLVVVLKEKSVVVDPVLVIRYATSPEGESRLPQQEVLKIGAPADGHAGISRIARVASRGEEEQLSVKGLRKVLVEIDAIEFSAEPKLMLSKRITCGIEESEIVL